MVLDREILGTGTVIVVARAKARVEVAVEERDKRTMNNMDPETKAIHLRLEEWGRWARDKGIQGYPSQSSTEKAAQYGKLGVPDLSQNKREPVMPDHVARLDSCVARCCQIDQQALRTYYEYQISLYELGRKLGMRERQARNVLRRARWRVAAHLAVIEG